LANSHLSLWTLNAVGLIIHARKRESRGAVPSGRGQYDAYVYKVNKEVEAGERELATERTKRAPTAAKPIAASRAAQRNERDARKAIKNLEKTIAQLDDQKRVLTAQSMQTTNAAEALRLHNELVSLTAKLAEAEERWCELQEEQ
jgi:ATP-binding cassette, subfamily F, member 3